MASPPVFYLPSLTVEGIEVPNVGWSYEQPFAGFEVIQDYLSFYPSKLECYVGEDRVLPQAGGS